jgi:hypothetical protein
LRLPTKRARRRFGSGASKASFGARDATLPWAGPNVVPYKGYV